MGSEDREEEGAAPRRKGREDACIRMGKREAREGREGREGRGAGGRDRRGGGGEGRGVGKGQPRVSG